MSRGLGPSLPSRSQEFLEKPSRHRMSIDIENQHSNRKWNEVERENRNDMMDYVGRPNRRLLQLDYDDSFNVDRANVKRNEPNAKNLLKIGLLSLNDGTNNEEATTTSNENKEQDRSAVDESASSVNAQPPTENPKSTDVQKCVENCNTSQKKQSSNSTSQKNDPKSNQKSHAKVPFKDSLLGKVNKVQIQLEFNLSNNTLEVENMKKKLTRGTTNDHSNFVKRSVDFGKRPGFQE